MEYTRIPLKNDLSVDSIVSVHYLEYTRTFTFAGEVHDFWEFIYVDKGRVFITAGNTEIALETKQLYLHKPMEFHSIRCDGSSTANAVVVAFDGSCKDLHSIAGRVLPCKDELCPLLAQIVSHAREAFSSPLGDPNVKELLRREKQPFASEQLIRLFLEEFLIRLIRADHAQTEQTPLPIHQQNIQNQRLKAICEYLETNVQNRLMFEDVCKQFSIGASALKKMFRDNVGCGVMEYYGRCKIERAKQMIREQNMNYTQIADALHYTTVQYFSRHFKRCTKMTPSEYADSVKRYMQRG